MDFWKIISFWIYAATTTWGEKPHPQKEQLLKLKHLRQHKTKDKYVHYSAHTFTLNGTLNGWRKFWAHLLKEPLWIPLVKCTNSKKDALFVAVLLFSAFITTAQFSNCLQETNLFEISPQHTFLSVSHIKMHISLKSHESALQSDDKKFKRIFSLAPSIFPLQTHTPSNLSASADSCLFFCSAEVIKQLNQTSVS